MKYEAPTMTNTTLQMGSASSGILPQPMQSGSMWNCPECRKWFALQLQSVRTDERDIVISTYRCRRCGFEIEFADSHPKGVV